MNKRKVICLAISSALTLGVCCALAFTMSSRAAKRGEGLADDKYYSLTMTNASLDGSTLTGLTDESNYPIQFETSKAADWNDAVVKLGSYGYMVNSDSLKGFTRLTARFTGTLYASTSVDGVNFSNKVELTRDETMTFANKANYVFLENDYSETVIWTLKFEYTCEAATGAVDNGWFVGKANDNNCVINKATEDGVRVNSAFCHLANFPLKTITNSASNYYVTAHVRWDQDESDGVEKYIGLVPYYANENDYVCAYVSYAAYSGTHSSYARGANIIWMHNGEMMTNTDGWTWGDCWNFQNHQMGFDETGVDVTVQKAGGAFTLTVNGISATISFRDFPTAMTNAVGGYCNGGNTHINAEFSDLEFDPNNEWYAYNIGGSNPTLTVNPSGSLSVGNCGWQNGFVIQDFTGSSYTLSTHVAGTVATDVTANVEYGFLAWYVDVNNYLIGYVDFHSDDRPHEIRSLQMTGKVGNVDVGWVGDIWCDGSAVHPADGFDFTVSASITGSGATFNASVSCRGGAFTKSGTWTVSGATSATKRVGVFSCGDSALFSSFSIN